jgi:hypothetical protein
MDHARERRRVWDPIAQRRTAGHSPGARIQGAQVLRPEVKDEVEFVTITMFDLLDAVKQFAGEDYEIGVIFARGEQAPLAL